MKTWRTALLRLLIVVYTSAALLVAGSGCGGAKSALSGLSSSSDDAAKLLSRSANAAELDSMASKLDTLISEVPKGSGLSASEQAAVDLAAQRTAVLKELARMYGASDDVVGLISKDAVTLVSGSILQTPSKAFREHLDSATQSLLKDTLCSSFADEMSSASGQTWTLAPAPSLPSPVGFQAPTQQSVLAELNAGIAAADFQLSAARRVVDLSGLSVKILAKVSGYVGKIKDTMTAAAWNNSGAFHAYLRHCVLK
ncbi:hypothetical protein ACIQC5_16175 [Paenarthrobacter sp. NPDC092416]|uniref:hypothetical protein n=1 Tax=Paenarthrobacter sp. NPDC092416 TaxID=3364386 RepID=UPI00380C69B8